MTVREKTYPDWVLRRVQELDLEILKAIDAICRERQLTYFADGGTCLGAVRHGGFIPWDDDIDVAMPLHDYYEFLRVAPECLPSNMSIHTMENTPGCSCLWAKVYINNTRFLDEGALEAGCEQGIFVDILPYIFLDGPAEYASRQLLKTQTWQKISYLRHMSYTNIPQNASHRIPKIVACTVAHAVLSRVASDELVRRRFVHAIPLAKKGDISANPCAARPYPYPSEVLYPPVEMDFEGMSIFVPRDADAYLTMLYGDYMALPAPEKRHVHTPKVLDFGDGVNVMETEGVQ